MILEIKYKNGSQLYEAVREVNVHKETLAYCRENYYAGVTHRINISQIENAFIMTKGHKVKII